LLSGTDLGRTHDHLTKQLLTLSGLFLGGTGNSTVHIIVIPHNSKLKESVSSDGYDISLIESLLLLTYNLA
jgi:hypothetical protein